MNFLYFLPKYPIVSLYIFSLLAFATSSYFREVKEVEEFSTIYTPFEICVANLTTAPIFRDSNTKICNGKSVQLQNKYVYPACVIGSSIFHVPKVKSEAFRVDTKEKCILRNITQRQGFRSVWMQQECSTTNLCRSKRLGESPLKILFQELKVLNISNIVMIGDSISLQLARFLGCDLSRIDGIRVIENNRLFDEKKTIKLEDNNYQQGALEYDQHVLNITVIYPKMTCLYETCAKEYHQLAVYNHLSKVFQDSVVNAHSSSPYLIIYNHGLHINLNNKLLQLPPALKALYDFAKLSSYSRKYFVFFRETTAQHFNGHILGDHEYQLFKSFSHLPNKVLCCGMQYSTLDWTHPLYTSHRHNYSNHNVFNWRNRIVREELTAIDKHWNEHISWIEAYNSSLQMEDLHVEYLANGHGDCTHFLYVPFLFNPIWTSLHQEIRSRLRRFQNKPIDPVSQQQQPQQQQQQQQQNVTRIPINDTKVLIMDILKGNDAFIPNVNRAHALSERLIMAGNGLIWLYNHTSYTKHPIYDLTKLQAMGFHPFEAVAMPSELLDVIPSGEGFISEQYASFFKSCIQHHHHQQQQQQQQQDLVQINSHYKSISNNANKDGINTTVKKFQPIQKTGKAIYLVYNCTTRLFLSMEDFYLFNFTWKDVVNVGDYLFQQIPIGPPVHPDDIL